MTARLQNSKFAGLDNKRWWSAPDENTVVKLIAKMFREITHLKPPRGRPGRQLDLAQHFAVEMTSDASKDAPFNAKQLSASFSQEMTTVEQRSERGAYGTLTSYSYEEEFAKDLNRLQAMHTKHQSLVRVQNTTRGLEDLVQGLMGLGLKDVNYETVGWRETGYMATMELENFIITIKEKGAQ